MEPVSAPDAATAVQTPSRPSSSLANLVVPLLETQPDLLAQLIEGLAAIVPPTFLVTTERKR